MTDNTLARQRGNISPLGLIKVIMICTIGAAVVFLAKSAATTGDQLIPPAVSSANAATPAETPPVLPSSAQAQTWDPVVYAPGDFDPAPGEIED